jgi:hypothetical protein
VKTALLMAACLAASIATAPAQTLGGNYRVAGKNFERIDLLGEAVNL